MSSEVKDSNKSGSSLDGCDRGARLCRVQTRVRSFYGDGDSSYRWQDQAGVSPKDHSAVLSTSQRRIRQQCIYLATPLQEEV